MQARTKPTTLNIPHLHADPRNTVRSSRTCVAMQSAEWALTNYPTHGLNRHFLTDLQDLILVNRRWDSTGHESHRFKSHLTIQIQQMSSLSWRKAAVWEPHSHYTHGALMIWISLCSLITCLLSFFFSLSYTLTLFCLCSCSKLTVWIFHPRLTSPWFPLNSPRWWLENDTSSAVNSSIWSRNYSSVKQHAAGNMVTLSRASLFLLLLSRGAPGINRP